MVWNYAQLWSETSPKWSQMVGNSQNLIENLLTEKKPNLSEVFGVKWPFFHLQCPFIFSEDVKNPIRNVSGAKKVGVTNEKMGIWPHKRLKMVEIVDDGPLYHLEWSKTTWVSLKYVVKWVKTVHIGLKSRQKLPKLVRNCSKKVIFYTNWSKSSSNSIEILILGGKVDETLKKWAINCKNPALVRFLGSNGHFFTHNLHQFFQKIWEIK